MVLGYKFVRFPFLCFIPLALFTSPPPGCHNIFIYFNFLCLVSVVGRVASDNFARFPAEMVWPLFHTQQHTHTQIDTHILWHTHTIVRTIW